MRRLLPNRFVVAVVVMVAALGTVATSAHADSPSIGVQDEVTDQCYASQELDRYRLLRRLSLDLRQTLPSYDEYLSLDTETTVPAAMLGEWLESDEFRLAMRRFHEDLLWPNLTGVALTEVNGRIVNQNGRYSILGTQKRQAFRGSSASCGNFEQTSFLADGSPAVPPGEVDGWVLVHPYWAPETEIKVCAYDAQVAQNGSFADCGSEQMVQDPKCGCGPDLRRCYFDGVETGVWDAMREQLGRSVDDVTVGDRPYSELLTSKRMHVSGRYEFWKKYMAPVVVLSRTWNASGPGDAPLAADPDWFDNTWRVVLRTGRHSGILTLPAYLLRFQTNRARANRFRTVFTSQYFVPADGEPAEGCSPTTTDLTNRCVCQTCHQVLEPLAAHFAEFIEAGSAPFDHAKLPVQQDLCANLGTGAGGPGQGNIRPTCNRFYVTQEGEPNLGTLLPWQYADVADTLHETIAANIESGPRGLAESTISSGLFHTSTVRNLFRFLMGRDMNLDPTDPRNELAQLSSLAAEFQVHDDFKQLVHELIALPQYRRIR